MRSAVCPGSFDPVTNGHIDIIGRAAALFDHVTVGVLVNQTKSSLFTVDERIVMLEEVCAVYPNVTVQSFTGLLVDFCRAAAGGVHPRGGAAPLDSSRHVPLICPSAPPARVGAAHGCAAAAARVGAGRHPVHPSSPVGSRVAGHGSAGETTQSRSPQRQPATKGRSVVGETRGREGASDGGVL